MKNEAVRIDFNITQESLDLTQTALSLSSRAANNISLVTGISRPSIGAKPFLLDISRLNGSTFWGSSYMGFLGNRVSDTSGRFLPAFTFDIVGLEQRNIHFFVLSFDSLAQQWATELMVNGERYENNSPSFIWEWQGQGDPPSRIPIQILRWNTPRYPVRITSIVIRLIKSYNRHRGLVNFKRGSQSTTNIEDVIEGSTLGQKGSFTIHDNDGLIRRLAEMQLLDGKQTVQLLDEDVVVGSYIFNRSNYDTRKKHLNVQLTDRTSEWQGLVNPEGINIFDRNNFEAGDLLGNIGDSFQSMKGFNNNRIRTHSLIPIQANRLYILNATTRFDFIVSQFDADARQIAVFNNWRSGRFTFTTEPNTAFLAYSVRNRGINTAISVSSVSNAAFELRESGNLQRRMTARGLYERLCNSDNSISYLDQTPMNYFDEFMVDYFFLELNNLRRSWRDFHDLTGTQGSLDENGNYVTRLL